MSSYLSWSQLYLYRKDPNEYFVQYVMGVKQPPTPAMMLGSLIHRAIGDNWDAKKLEMQMKGEHYTSDYIRTGISILSKAPRYPLQEERIVLEPSAHNGLKVPVMAILDGLDDVLNKIGEHKTTSSGWSQQQVDEHDQLTLYDLVCYYKYNKIFLNELNVLNVNNGKVKTYISTRSEKQILDLRDEINATYEDLVRRGWWERKQNSYAKI